MATWLGKLLSRQTSGALGGYYVATNGSSTASGDMAHPWDIATGLAGGYPANKVQPGDTVWIRGGTYSGTYTITISGTNGNPIKFRAYPGERATIDVGQVTQNTAYGLEVHGNYIWLWGLEVFNSYTTRMGDQNNCGFKALGASETKFINCISHDNYENFTAQAGTGSIEIHGCLSYYNGCNAADRGHGHGLYTQNSTGTVKTITNNFFLEPAFPDGCNCLQAYGSSAASFKDSVITGNLFTRASTIWGGLSGFPLTNDTLSNNMLWGGTSGGNVNFGDKSTDCSGTVATGNYFANVGASSVMAAVHPATGLDIHGNTFIGDADDPANPTDWPTNTWIAKGSPPSVNKVFVLGNSYEANRANVIVYNWHNDSSVSVDLSSAVASGTAINIYNAQDFFGSPVYSGTYNGGTVSIPMTGLTVTQVVGHGIDQTGGWGVPDIITVSTTGPAFGAFIVRQQGA
jgi:uncharacterized protein YraI